MSYYDPIEVAAHHREGARLDTRGLRACLGKFATGVTVVTTATEEGPRGVTVNAFTSVSLDPPLVLISIARRARTHNLLASRPFAVNVLRVDQEPLARHFAGQASEEISPPWADGIVAPRIEGCLAHLECQPWRSYDGGDHTLYLGEVVAFDHEDGDALGFFAGRFVAVAKPIPAIPPLPYDPFELPYDALD